MADFLGGGHKALAKLEMMVAESLLAFIFIRLAFGVR